MRASEKAVGESIAGTVRFPARPDIDVIVRYGEELWIARNSRLRRRCVTSYTHNAVFSTTVQKHSTMLSITE